MRPIFLLSLPRSGSTLLQRVLASHPEVATTSEPWLLLPSVYALRSKGIAAEYEHLRLTEALEDYCDQLPRGTADYLDEISKMVLRLYAKAAGSANYFLDKTPRYHLILDELFLAFPTARIIILWRNPLAVAASMIETWNEGKWNLHWFYIDLYTGLANLVNACKREHKRIITLRFEDFVADPDAQCQKIFQYLELPHYTKLTTSFSDLNLQGRMGDPTGVSEYRTISAASLNKWQSTLANPLRRSWARRYLNWIGESRLAVMGYQVDELLHDLRKAPITANRLLSDLARIGYGKYYVSRNRKCLYGN